MSYSPFEALGIELEYMLVRADDLDVAPVADKIFVSVAGEAVNEIEGSAVDGQSVDWSNELVRHVVELKNPSPTTSIASLAEPFKKEIERLATEAEKLGCLLLPTAMHPWMNPETDTQLWPLQQKKIYETYDRIFKCKGHGWANLQSTHINLSFGRDDRDFGLAHAALRIVTPLIPVIASSSPYQEGMRGPYSSTRLYHYFQNQKRIPSIIGPVIPEPVWSVEDYQRRVLEPMYAEIAPFDQEGVLKGDWLNSRAVIAKFDYNRLEIRVMDIQECAQADLALAWFFIEIARKLLKNTWCDEEQLKSLSSEDLRAILFDAAKNADSSLIEHRGFLKCFGINNPRIEGLELLKHLLSEIDVRPEDQTLAQTCHYILSRGSLSRCILRNLGDSPSRDEMRAFYTQLSKNLLYNQVFND